MLRPRAFPIAGCDLMRVAALIDGAAGEEIEGGAEGSLLKRA